MMPPANPWWLRGVIVGNHPRWIFQHRALEHVERQEFHWGQYAKRLGSVLINVDRLRYQINLRQELPAWEQWEDLRKIKSRLIKRFEFSTNITTTSFQDVNYLILDKTVRMISTTKRLIVTSSQWESDPQHFWCVRLTCQSQLLDILITRIEPREAIGNSWSKVKFCSGDEFGFDLR